MFPLNIILLSLVFREEQGKLTEIMASWSEQFEKKEAILASAKNEYDLEFQGSRTYYKGLDLDDVMLLVRDYLNELAFNKKRNQLIADRKNKLVELLEILENARINGGNFDMYVFDEIPEIQGTARERLIGLIVHVLDCCEEEINDEIISKSINDFDDRYRNIKRLKKEVEKCKSIVEELENEKKKELGYVSDKKTCPELMKCIEGEDHLNGKPFDIKFCDVCRAHHAIFESICMETQSGHNNNCGKIHNKYYKWCSGCCCCHSTHLEFCSKCLKCHSSRETYCTNCDKCHDESEKCYKVECSVDGCSEVVQFPFEYASPHDFHCFELGCTVHSNKFHCTKHDKHCDPPNDDCKFKKCTECGKISNYYLPRGIDIFCSKLCMKKNKMTCKCDNEDCLLVWCSSNLENRDTLDTKTYTQKIESCSGYEPNGKKCQVNRYLCVGYKGDQRTHNFCMKCRASGIPRRRGRYPNS